MTNIIEISESNFNQVVSENSLLVIDFWAEWCAPCKTFAKVIEKIAPDYPEVVFGSINIDKEKQLAKDFHVMSVPSIMVMRDQVIVFADSGALTDTSLRNLLNQAKELKKEDLAKKSR